MGHHGLTGTPTGHVPQTRPNCRLRQPAVRLSGIEEGLVTLVLGKKGQSWHHTSPYTTPREHCPLGRCLQPTWQDGQQLWRRTGSVPSVPGASPSLSPSLYICYRAETRSGPQRSTALTLQDPPSPQAAPLLRGLFHPQNPAAAFSGGRVFPPPPHPQAQVGGRGSSLPHPPHIAWSSGGQAPRHARSPCDSQALSQLLSLDSPSSSKDRKNSDFIPLSPMRKLRLRQMQRLSWRSRAQTFPLHGHSSGGTAGQRPDISCQDWGSDVYQDSLLPHHETFSVQRSLETQGGCLKMLRAEEQCLWNQILIQSSAWQWLLCQGLPILGRHSTSCVTSAKLTPL